MTIIRRRHTKNFTVIGNEVFSDERLELDALGLLCYLRSRPHDWNISTEHLRRRFGCGPEKMQRLMRELIAVGWIQRHELPRGPRGIYGGFEYVVLDEPDLASDDQNAAETQVSREAEKPTPVPESVQPTPGEPCTAEPESVEPESANPTAYLELDSTKGFSPLYPPASGGTRPLDEDRISEQEAWIGNRPERGTERRPRLSQGCRGAAPPPVPPEIAARFERLWAAYPESGRLAADRPRAVALFAALDPADQERAIHAASAEARTRARHRSQARALHRWFERGLWRNGAPASGGVGSAGTTAASGIAAADPFAVRNAAGMDQARRGQWPGGCTHFVLADSDEGAAWEAYFAERAVKPRWMSMPGGLGAYMPAPFPPATAAA
ncbi:helix-turn-helix domain-containing protein [Methylobacterium sp. GC_Met_2]|uniref:helix-turn-helix domain-containing protein n=1 Tax=Methylobacterium sp. GC_Met_2 TaxID=2937376 RepID=UPI00226B969E|nr:helix-turn-helix domain-containing protein [Methylobacterium sp. GC_Met_2]